MSLEAMTWVFKHSEAHQGDRLVLLALARKARLSKRQAQRCLRNLCGDGRITEVGTSQYGTTIYRVEREVAADEEVRRQREAGGDKTSPVSAATRNATGATRSASQVSPEPSEENHQESSATPGDAHAQGALGLLDKGEAWRGVYEAVQVLERVPRERGAKVPTVEAVGAVRDRYPDLDLEALARDMLLWATHGNGARRKIKSVVGTFANFCKRAEDDRVAGRGGARPASRSPRNPVTSSSDKSWDAGLITE
jgi:hypothetical protein